MAYYPQAYPVQQQPVYMAPDSSLPTQSNPHSYQQQQWQQSDIGLLQNSQGAPYPQSVQAPNAQVVVAPHFCSPFTSVFFLNDKLLSWSGRDASVLNQHGHVTFVLDSKALSLRGSRVLKDTAGNRICAMQAKVISLRREWVICRGATVSDHAMVARVTKEVFSMHRAVQVKLTGSNTADYTLRQQGYIAGRREIDIMHHNRIIGHVRRARSGEAIFLNKQSYQLTLDPGYDHAFLLCVLAIFDEYFHESQGG